MRVVLAATGALAAGVLVAASCASDPSAASDDAGAPPIDATIPSTDGGIADAAPDRDAAVDATDAAEPLVDTCGDAGAGVDDAWLVDPKLCLTVYATDMTVARQLAVAPNGDLFVQAGTRVWALFDTNHDRKIDPVTEVSPFADTPDGADPLNHGLAFSTDGAWVYASNPTTVFRWPYTAGSHQASAPPEVVVHDIPVSGHSTRTLVFDAQGRLYVSVGSFSDVDQDDTDKATRSMIRRFVIPAAMPAGGLAYIDGEVYASGLRNEVGLSIDKLGRMWGVENGSDGVGLPQFGDISQDNPAEELNRLDEPGSRFFGYPLCWSEFAIDGGGGNGTQWAYLFVPGEQSDSWCRNPANVHPPKAGMHGHWAPLGVTVYSGHSLPWNGDLFVTSHGSSSRIPAVGRLVARAHLVGNTVVSVTPVVGHRVDGGLEEGTWGARPVDIVTGADGALYFSDDFSNRVFRLGYRP